ncbi:MAG: MmcQ/YjbR family DNA-binding protein [Gemmatimonadota bacterium]|nr:MmcQ/YjbR family DNA-binding protein [Gemmatimonadota bacterium]
MARSVLDRLRSLCLKLPEAHEVEAWGAPTFRVKNKIFAMYAYADTHAGAGKNAVWFNANSTNQGLLVRAEPERYFVPPYVGPKGWVGAYLGKETDWAAVADLARDAYRLTATKKLAAQLID